ncbi:MULTISPECIES: hypothetical protein [Actinopolyspora]|uniref:Uncharacterized protein n=1 Tax=Actinopolyspora saharensis TaxID=995062 RepID=A0A1H0ZVI7_9ACTN|nr:MULTISPECIES: hypothetical protein [Actinopolyspora]NHD15556.1 hypothetical protein [Actinopolyspora sp. BKK2]NHE75230.1 hypothetical protein [Actinopolyspora sp. BKK1]SDQ31457.1 hypothetical protein SAMN04489718_1265 [Actinopolyspora saharensis]
MNAHWVVAGEHEHAPVYLAMSGPRRLELRQGEAVLSVGTGQLHELLDTLFWLDELYRVDLQEAAAHLSERAVAAG